MIDAAERALDMHDQSQSARLVYLALRTGGWSTADELADAVGVSRPAASRTAKELTEGGWARERTREQASPGPSPSEWVALVECAECGGRYVENGLPTHQVKQHSDAPTANKLQQLTPEDLGLGGDKPEPKRGIQ